MHPKTIDALNRLNKDFYERIGPIWNQDPHYYWDGWDQIIPLLHSQPDLSILDIGCGNGRFANYAAIHAPSNTYVGVDFATSLINESRIPPHSTLIQSDLFHTPIVDAVGSHVPASGGFDLIVLFGLLHHVPSYNLRTSILKQSIDLLSKNGSLVLTTWEYMNIPRLAKRVIAPGSDEFVQVTQDFGIDASQLEPGDNILSWVKKIHGYRYSHSFDAGEIPQLISQLGCKLTQNYVHDGKLMRRNHYYVLTRL